MYHFPCFTVSAPKVIMKSCPAFYRLKILPHKKTLVRSFPVGQLYLSYVCSFRGCEWTSDSYFINYSYHPYFELIFSFLQRFSP